jgi:hypothetical protein
MNVIIAAPLLSSCGYRYGVAVLEQALRIRVQKEKKRRYDGGTECFESVQSIEERK